ncbi:ZP domain-containing protein-like [Lampris incognitus]|uniref:ZP domain-containing protein-like n=1 Tax=Lampris incognitus TaxID=2546036 RepID=UPI0024B59819|nr:ZP domain-containing protein-like [Lampris incognitus]
MKLNGTTEEAQVLVIIDIEELDKYKTHQNCFSKLPLLAYDADRDHVRCRFAANASVDSAFILDENTCTVKLKGNAGLGVHVFDLLLEDFPRRDVTLSYADGTSSVRTAFNASSNADSPPFSRVSLQFTLEVLPPLSSCDAGHVVPKLLQPTPSNGGVLYAAVGAPLQLVVLATANQAKIYDFQVSGPVNVTKRFSEDQFGKAEVTLSWRPLPRDLRRAVPLCFAAETNVSQSEMRCVVVIVTRSPTAEGKASVSCSATQMTVVLEKATMPDIDKNWLKLADPSCSLTSNNTHIMATMSFSTCGTTVEDKVDYIVFKNTIISFERPNTIITRRRQVDIGFSCQFPKSLSVSSHYQLDRSDYVFTESSFGSFQYNFEVFNDNNFTQRVEPGAYPVEVELMDVIYMGIQAKSDLPDVSLFVESCRATPENNPKSILLYDLIQNGCLRDETIKVHPSNSTSFLFEIQAFKFNGNYDEVYISCSVLLCENGNPASRCAQGCLKSPQRRRKRNDVRETASHFITQGPLRFVRQADSGAVAKEPKGDSGEEVGARGFLGTNTGTVVFASLFAVSVVILAVIVALLTRKKKKVEDARGLLVFDSEY